MSQVFKPKIAIVGSGAVGSVIGGLLAREGENATLIARKAHVETINKNGLFIDGILGSFSVHVQAKEELTFRPDLVLLTVKAQDVESVCRQIKPYITDVPVVTLQNGIRSEEMAASLLGEKNIIRGVVLFNAQFLKSGCVTYGEKGSLLLGEAFRQNGRRVADIAGILRRAIKTEVSDNIYGVRWTKLLVRVMVNSLEAMTGLSFKECMRYPGMRRIGMFILREAFEVVEKAGVKLEPLPGLPLTVFKLIIKSPLVIASLALRLRMSSTDTITSTLQSMRRGRPTEINYLNGEIVIQGRAVNISTPYNLKAVELVHAVERTGRFCSPLHLESQFLSG
ncbi:MAG: 2-dehydropantoate 2-reductase [Candidatus Omnitrophica bacterium]|nr:2-dehydropantoate 2-reductase [Candidatus Omnitrophota bacterium]